MKTFDPKRLYFTDIKITQDSRQHNTIKNNFIVV
jgi:hypothetical protein